MTDTFTGDVVVHCHLLLREDEGCMTQMMVVKDKAAEPWGYCVHSTQESAAVWIWPIMPALLSCLLAMVYSGHLQRGCSTRCGCTFGRFGGWAILVAILALLVPSALTLVHDDGHDSTSLVASLHANEDSYYELLGLRVIFMLLVVASGVWVTWHIVHPRSGHVTPTAQFVALPEHNLQKVQEEPSDKEVKVSDKESP